MFNNCRPVTKYDKWCKRRKDETNLENSESWGIIITVPYCYTYLGQIRGRIVRTKKEGKNLLLQVIPYTYNDPLYKVVERYSPFGKSYVTVENISKHQ